MRVLRGIAGRLLAAGLLLGAAVMLPHAGPLVTPALAGERLVLPFACAVENGRVRVTPSAAPQSYPILGSREQQPFTVCPDGDLQLCRMWVLNRFSVSCDGQRAAWIDVVGAVADTGLHDIRIDNGRLSFSASSPRRAWHERNCDPPGSRLPPRIGQRPSDAAACADQASDRIAQPVVLPRGFAPIGLFGDRIEAGAAPLTVAALPDPAAAAPEAAAQPARTAAEGGRLPADVVRDAVASPPAPDAPAAVVAAWPPAELKAEPVAEPRPRSDATPLSTSWVTVVEAATGERSGDHMLGALPFMIGLVALMLTMLLLRYALMRRSAPAAARVRLGPLPNSVLRTTPRAGARAQDAEMTQALRSRAERQIEEVHDALRALSAAQPLRSALTREVTAVERRLAAALATGMQSAEDWRQARRRLERAVLDLARLNEIAESAARSFKGSKAGEREPPRDKAAAYDALGVNPDVDEKVLKKLVDALRASWHPDLAKSEPDRQMREERIKEINIAWDLIMGKREEG